MYMRLTGSETTKMSNRTKADIRKLIQYSESVDAKVSENSREALRSLIDQGPSKKAFAYVYPFLGFMQLYSRIHGRERAWNYRFVRSDRSKSTELVVEINRSFIIRLFTETYECESFTEHKLSDRFKEHYLKSRERRAFTILEPELDRNRWSQREAHDFVADCRHVLVRPTVVPLSLQSKHTHLSLSRSAKSSSIMHPVDYHRTSESSLFSSSTHSICSSSNTNTSHILIYPFITHLTNLFFVIIKPFPESSASNWDMDVDVWSPSINLGIETPPETRCATPLVHRPNTISNSTILPGSVSSRRSTAASDELRQRPSTRHSSFGQKFTDIFRGRSRASEMKERCNDAHDRGAEQRDRRSALSIENILAGTKEEDSEENIEVINAKAEITRRDSEASQVEEALDATDICLSPSSTLSYRTSTDRASTTITPTITLTGSKKILDDEFDNDEKSVLNSDLLNDTSSTVHVENDLDSGELMQGLSDEKSIRSYCCADVQRYEGDKKNGRADGMQEDEDQREENDVFLTEQRLSAEKKNREATTTANEQRFSVSSFFRVVNRQRFTSECPPPMLITDLVYSHPPARNNRRFTLHRVSSCPNLCESIHSQINTSAIQNNKSIPKPSLLTASQINSAIKKDFPYLAFLRSVPFGNIDEEGIDMELNEEHEKTRRSYMEACIEHHSCLKQLGLADRLPAKIYDDMTAFLHGLSFEKQRDILSTRLSLVNQHLLYERCGRLLHAERNRRLFGRLIFAYKNAQKAVRVTIKKQFVSFEITTLYSIEGRIKQQKLSDAEKVSLQKSLHNALLEREQLVSALTEFRKRSMAERKKRDEIENAYREQLLRCQHESDKYVRELDKLDHRVTSFRCENAEVELSLAQSKITELQQIKPQLQNAFTINRQLKDKIAQCETYAKAVNTARAIELSTLSEHSDQQLLAQISQLKMELRRERNARDASKMKTMEIEDEWKQERQRVNDLKVMLERAATNLLYNRKSASSHEANPMPIPKSSVPDEILSYDSSVCGSDNTPFFPPELFAKHSICSVPVETGTSAKYSSVNRNTIAVNHPDFSVVTTPACKDSFDKVDARLQSGTL
ncbi:unnamed protein product [Anisakis simplex]|uniref:Hamartin (inferred by orthology to a human protein) n=1 Tax=Anisakis simplex TaxID=6269 RepID=A0A0M3JVU2_ANISI|nr:unnamed protein product [Anisakis simplex]